MRTPLGILSVVLILVSFSIPLRIAHAGEFGLIGDAGSLTQNAQLVRESIHRSPVRSLVMPGDNLYFGTYPLVWNPWRQLGFQFDVVAIGNHHGGYDQEVRYFNLPGQYYSRVFGNTQMIVLNSDCEKSVTKQMAWLETTLEETQSSFVFLVYHHPSFTVSQFHQWREKKEFQLALRPLLLKYRSKLTALIVGHDHLASFLHFDDLPVILSGAVQGIRRDRPVDNIQDGVAIKTAWYFDHTPHWAWLSTPDGNEESANAAKVTFVRAKDDTTPCSMTLRTGERGTLGTECALNIESED